MYVKAVRKAAPVLISLASPSGGGKTTSGLLLAAGIAADNERVALLDAENGRGSLVADYPIIQKALPDGYDIDSISAPYSPERFVEKIAEAEKAGIKVLCIDSATHEWEGEGGCTDIAEKFAVKGRANWAKAKLSHKRFLNHCLSSAMHIVFCLRAREKVKMLPNGNVEPLGILAVQEKSFLFEQTLRWDIEVGSHIATLLKAPETIEGKLRAPRMLSKNDGRIIREWNLSGGAADPATLVRRRARAAAEEGEAYYKDFFEKQLTQAERALVGQVAHLANKDIAVAADKEMAELREMENAAAEETAQ